MQYINNEILLLFLYIISIVFHQYITEICGCISNTDLKNLEAKNVIEHKILNIPLKVY